MPELPEVETIVRQLKPQILNKKIVKVEIFRISQWKGTSPEDIVSPVTINLFKNISRRAKYIIFELNNGFFLLIHLRMSGKLIWTESWTPIDKYSRTIFYFEDESSLQFNDTRALGTLEVIKPDQQPECLKKLGIEPLDKEFTYDLLKRLIIKSKLEIKDFLMDQKKIVGIGNIYANEILFHCKIHPKRVANSLKPDEVENLFQFIPQVLNTAIAHMGTTIGNKASDYRSVYNVEGTFQSLLQVYGRANEPCYNCSKPIIRIIQKGRSSFCCENCQK